MGVIGSMCLGATAQLPAQVGRYAIAAKPDHAFVLDTATGKVWRGYYPPGNGNTDPDFLKEKNQ